MKLIKNQIVHTAKFLPRTRRVFAMEGAGLSNIRAMIYCHCKAEMSPGAQSRNVTQAARTCYFDGVWRQGNRATQQRKTEASAAA